MVPNRIFKYHVRYYTQCIGYERKVSMKEKRIREKIRPRDNIAGWLFILPSLIGLLAFCVLPVLFSMYISFTDWNFLSGLENIKLSGIGNYIDLFKDEWFLESLWNSIVIAITTVPIGLIAGLVIAYLIDTFAYGKNLFKILLFIPYISSVVASAIVWGLVFHPTYGPVNEFLRSIGIENVPKWFMDMKWSLPSVIVFTIWVNLGYHVVVYTAGLKNIPREIFEAAEIDGANSFQKFTKIVIKMVSPTTFFLCILGILGSFKTFDQIMVLTGGGPGRATSNIAIYIYKMAFEKYEMGMASAGAWVMFLIILVITIIQWKNEDKFTNE